MDLEHRGEGTDGVVALGGHPDLLAHTTKAEATLLGWRGLGRLPAQLSPKLHHLPELDFLLGAYLSLFS